MKITGSKRWLLLVIVSIFSGTMVITPYLRFNYYDQIVILLTQSHPIVDAAVINEYIGDLAMVFGAINMVMYIVGGLLVDKYGERIMLLLGGLMMAAGSVLYGLVLSKAALMAGFVLFGFGTGTMWGGYLKLTRKLGSASEQGRMYSTSEFIRGITGTCLGLLGVAVLNQAILPDGITDPVLIGEKWRTMLFLHAAIYIISVILCMILVPKNVIGVSASQAATFAIIRNYFIAAISTFAIGYVAVKLKSESKTIGVYSLISGILMIIMLLSAGNFSLCIGSTFIFAIAYTGMRGLYFAVPAEVGIPVRLTGVTTGIMSLIGYLPDVFFAKLAGRWLDQHGLAGYNYIWYWGIACALIGTIVCLAACRYAKKTHTV